MSRNLSKHPSRRLLIYICTATLLFTSLVSCQNMFKLPRLPKNVLPVKSGITKIHITDITNQGTSVEVEVWFENPNDFELPLLKAKYSMNLDSKLYEGDLAPNITLPKKGRVNLRLPAAFAVSALAGMNYAFIGEIHFRPPGEIQRLLNDLGTPLPNAKLSIAGHLTAAQTNIHTKNKTAAKP